MIAGESCYRLNGGPPLFSLPHRVKLPDGSTRTDPGQWFSAVGESLGYTASTVTQEEADAFAAAEASQALTAAKAEKIRQLTQWWDTHPGIEVASGVVLPIQEGGRTTNASSLAIALIVQSSEVDLVDVNDYTVSLPLASAITALGAFRAAYDPISAMWDTTHQALIAATTLAELDAVEMPV